MIGPQSSSVQTQLGPVINGIVNYQYWLPVPAMNFPGVHDLIVDTSNARRARLPTNWVLRHAVRVRAGPGIGAGGRGDRGLDDSALADFTRQATFSTVVGDVTFGRLGEWAVPRVLTVQFRGIGSSDISEFGKPKARVVVAPASYASGELVVPYRAAATPR